MPARRPTPQPDPAILAGFRTTQYTFQITRHATVTIEESMGVDPPTDWANGRPVRRWAVRCDGGVWTRRRDGFEYEPLPSSRDAAFIRRARWDTLEEAFAEACLAVAYKRRQLERMMS